MLSLRPLVRAEPILGREVMWYFVLTAGRGPWSLCACGGFTLAEIEVNG